MSRLPGSSIPLKKAILCPLIFVGEVVSQGNVEPSAPGQATFDQFNVKVVECLKGEVKGEVSLSMTVRTFPPKEAEMIPKEGERYVFFVQAEGQDARRHSVIRVLSASNEVIECVRTLVEMQADFADPPAVPPK